MEESVRVLVEKDRIVDAITELFVATDRRDGDAVRACLAPRVALDMSSLTGAPASAMAGEEIARGWAEGLKPIREVHHQAGRRPRAGEVGLGPRRGDCRVQLLP